MDTAVPNEGRQPLLDRPIAASATFEGSAGIAEARDMARSFLTVQAEHGLPVSARAMGMVQLVVSELVTNARKYAPGPCLLDLEIIEGAVRITVWDSDTTLPSAVAADAERVGQHGLEIAMAVSQTFCIYQEPVGKRISVSVVLADDPGGTTPVFRPCEVQGWVFLSGRASVGAKVTQNRGSVRLLMSPALLPPAFVRSSTSFCSLRESPVGCATSLS